MTFNTHNDKHIDINMTHLLGYCENLTRYSDLVALFGEPTDGDGYKVDAEWCIEFEDGKVATIYNYKTGKNYCGKSGFSVDILAGQDCHIGGKDEIVVERVHKLIRDHQRETAQKAAA